jgi:hypothetical protein
MKASQTHYPSFFGFLLFIAAALFLLTTGIILGASALFAGLVGGEVDARGTIYSVTIGFIGILLGGIAVVSFLKFLNKPAAEVPVATSLRGWQIAAGAVAGGLALLLGHLIQGNTSVNWLILPPLTIPAVMLPIWLLTSLGARDLSLGSRWRAGSVLGLSLTITPFILFALEVVVIILIFIFVVMYAVATPDVAAEFEHLSRQFMFIDPESDEAIKLLLPYFVKPGVLVPVALFFSVVIPLLEELLKPLAVWLLVNKLESAGQGFALGALSGAGFAIIETFNVSGQMAEWGGLLFTRIGTGLLHITTSALMGGAIYLAFRERRYLRLVASYLLVVLLHGLWNFAAVANSFSALLAGDGGLNTTIPVEVYQAIETSSAIGLVLLTVILLALLILGNRRRAGDMTRSETSPAAFDDTSIS